MTISLVKKDKQTLDKKYVVIKVLGGGLSGAFVAIVKKIGTNQNWLERILTKNKSLKKYIKMFTWYFGTKAIEKAAFSATYKTVWCAGPSIEFTEEISTTKQVVEKTIMEFEEAYKKTLSLRVH